jgi:hypothetical protein
MMDGLPMSVISIFSVGITGSGASYSRVRAASARPPGSGVLCEEEGVRE